MFSKILRKIYNFVLIPFTFQNWPSIMRYVLSIYLSILTKHKTGLAVLRKGQRLRIRLANALDIGSVLETYQRKVYTPSFMQIPDDAIVIDIGASIGDFSVFCASSFKNAKVLSYEPNPEAFKILKENIQVNNLADNVKIYSLAVTGIGKKISIGAELYDSVSMEDIFEENKINHCDLLKMDIEGAEYEVLLNTKEEILKRINTIVMECHISDTGKNLTMLREYLIRSGDFDVITTPVNAHNICYLYAKRK